MRRPAIARNRAALAAVAASGVAAALFRLPFLGFGLGPDEGGYAYVADQWAHGARLYSQAWVDRPQGLLLAYRLLLSIAHTAWAIRLGALLFGVAITLLLGAIGWLLRGPATGAAASAIYAAVGVAPHLQGFTFNGELAAALPATAAVAAALAWRRSPRTAWLVAAGLAAGAGPLMKQSGFDGLIVAGALVVSAAGTARQRLRRSGAFLGAACVPLGASALHGWSVGWHDYWFAVVGYKLGARSGATLGLARRLAAMQASAPQAWRDLGVVLLLALAGLVVSLRRRSPILIPMLWLAAAFLGVNTASLYWPHYYVQLIAPLVLLAAVGATSGLARLPPALLVAAAAAPVLVFLVRLGDISPTARQFVVPYYHQFQQDEAVADSIDPRLRPGDTVYALDSEADLYFLVGRGAAYPYLWGHPLEEIPGALGRLRVLLASPRRPRWLVQYTPAGRVDPSGRLQRIVTRDYRLEGVVPGTHVELYRS